VWQWSQVQELLWQEFGKLIGSFFVISIEELKQKLNQIGEMLEDIQVFFPIENLESECEKLRAEQTEPDFYNDRRRVESVGKKLSSLTERIDLINGISRQYDELNEFLCELSENDQELLADANNEVASLFNKTETFHLNCLLKGKFDKLGAILSIQAGAGGTEAQDWAGMLLRMYTRFCEKQGYSVSTLDYTLGEGAGIKGATIRIDGDCVYGFLKSEKGVHRLVRISPFDSNARRHTSFASVEIMPQLEDEGEIEIKDSDLKIDTYHSGGCGGQGVNTTDSAVRIRHIPTGIVVQCQNERSQIQNKETALKVLRAKLAVLYEEERQKNLKEVQGGLKKIEWGSQIRSYVFCPYTLVKDHRTDYETSNVEAVMDGDILDFIMEYLKKSEKFYGEN